MNAKAHGTKPAHYHRRRPRRRRHYGTFRRNWVHMATFFSILLTIPGNILLSESAAACAFLFPPFLQSSNSKRVCRTGLENDIRELSTKVIFRTPQP